MSDDKVKNVPINQDTKPISVSESVVTASNKPDVEVDRTVAFTPFENSVFDMSGLLTMIEDLALIERSLFRGKEGTISFKARDFTTSSVLAIFEDIEKTGLEPTTEASQLKFLKALIAHLKSLPVVKIRLAFDPTTTFLHRLSGDVSAAMGKKAVVDLTIDQHIIGGAVFEYGGKISINTLDSKLEEVLANEIGGLS